MADKTVQSSQGPFRVRDNDDNTWAEQMGLRQSANTTAAVIAINTAVSGAIDVRGFGPRGLAVQTPAAWTAADIALQVSDNSTDFFPIYGDTGARVKITTVATAAAQVYIFPPEVWIIGAYKYIRLESINTVTGAAENQTTARTLSVRFLA